MNPIVAANQMSKIAIVGQAPGIAVHRSGIPWKDKSGDRLRSWLGVSDEVFYNDDNFAIIPMGFCYPGKGKSGDLPPRKECAPLWHANLFNLMKGLQLVLLVGSYAQKYYLPQTTKLSLTTRVRKYQDFLPKYLPIPHPSPRNNIWISRNPWFEEVLIPDLQAIVYNALNT